MDDRGLSHYLKLLKFLSFQQHIHDSAILGNSVYLLVLYETKKGVNDNIFWASQEMLRALGE